MVKLLNFVLITEQVIFNYLNLNILTEHMHLKRKEKSISLFIL